MACLLPDLFASMPEIDDLYAEVVGGPPRWISVAYDQVANARRPARKVTSTYGLLLDSSGKVSVDSLHSAGWPIAEIRQETDGEGTGSVFRARVDHAGHDTMWPVLPTHSSPFGNNPALLFPTMGGLREYRTIAAVTLYALSIMARYMPGAWRRIEGGDQDHYLALVQASLAVWERLLPEHFLESIAERNRAHCATRELDGVSSLSVRNIRLIYGSLVRVTSSNAEVGICAPRPSCRRVAAPFVPGDVLRCHRRARRHPSIGHATDRDCYGPNGSRKPPSICTPARGPDGMPGTTTNRVPTRSPRPRSDTGSSRSFEVSAVPSRSLATPRPFFQDPAAPRGPSRPLRPCPAPRAAFRR